MNDVAFIPKRLKELRRKDRSTQEAFGSKIGCTKASVSAYETGVKIPSTQTLVNIAKVCDCSIDWLFGIECRQGFNTSKGTYSDFFQKILSLDTDALLFLADMKGEKVIYFTDPIVNNFVKEWEKVRRLYEAGTIDRVIYQAWKEKMIRDYDYDMLNPDTSEKQTART